MFQIDSISISFYSKHFITTSHKQKTFSIISKSFLNFTVQETLLLSQKQSAGDLLSSLTAFLELKSVSSVYPALSTSIRDIGPLQTSKTVFFATIVSNS